MKVWFDSYSCSPFILLMEKKESDSIGSDFVVDITEEEFEDYEKTAEKFMEWQSKIDDLRYKFLPRGIQYGRI